MTLTNCFNSFYLIFNNAYDSRINQKILYTLFLTEQQNNHYITNKLINKTTTYLVKNCSSTTRTKQNKVEHFVLACSSFVLVTPSIKKTAITKLGQYLQAYFFKNLFRLVLVVLEQPQVLPHNNLPFKKWFCSIVLPKKGTTQFLNKKGGLCF